MNKIGRLYAVCIVLSLFLTACGGGGGNSTPTTGIVNITSDKVASPVVEDNTPTTSSASITDDNAGNPVVGDSLTGNYNFSDVNGNINGTFTFRWLRHGIPISGATASTYTLVVADSGQPIIFEVTLVSTAGTGTGSAVVASGITVVNSAPIASSVNISGSFVLGGGLTGNYTYVDVDADLEGLSTFRWLRNGIAINGGTGSSYTLVAADIGQLISFEVMPVAIDGINTGSAVVSSSIMIGNSAPTANSVTLSGSAAVGATLTGSYSYNDVDGDGEGLSTFRWLRNGIPIGGATASTYTLVAADSGQTIVFEVTPVASAGTSAGSAAVSSGIIINNTSPTASGVNISGSAVVGATLTSSYTYNDLDGDAQGVSTFRWLRAGTPISGATTTSYMIVTADSAQTLTFEVTPVAATGTTMGSAVASSGITVVNDTIAPTVSSTVPATAATGVARNVAITANFNEDIFAITVDSSSFTLDNGSSVSGAVTFNGTSNIATFTPTSNLAILTSYTAILTTAITDLVGNPLASNYTWSFTTDEGAWGTAGLIELNNEGNALSAQVAVDSNGNVVAVWNQDIFGQTSVLANRYVVGIGWGVAELIESGTGVTYVPQIAIDSIGNAIAVWHQGDATTPSIRNIWANRYVVGVGWGTAELIASSTETADMSQISMDSSGNATAVWRQYNGIDAYNIWANRYTAGSWGTAVLVTADNTTNARDPQIGVDGSGNAIAIWRQDNGATVSNIWANRYTAGSWGTAVLVTTDNTSNAYDPQVELDGSGNAIVVWSQYDGSIDSILANRYVVGIGWGTAVPIETDSGTASYPQVAVDSSGNAIAVWRQFNGSRSNIVANRYVVGSGWSTAEFIETGTGFSNFPQIAIDSNGNAIAVWTQNVTGQVRILANRYVVGTGWGTEEVIETSTTGTTGYSPQVVIDSLGKATAVWHKDDGAPLLNIQSNRFE